MGFKTIHIAVPAYYDFLKLTALIEREHGSFFYTTPSSSQVNRLLEATAISPIDNCRHLRLSIEVLSSEGDESDTQGYSSIPQSNLAAIGMLDEVLSSLSGDANSRPIFDLYYDATALIESKASDYSEPGDAHSNFVHAGYITNLFPPLYKPYAVLIGVKLARLAVLMSSEREPQYESVRDSIIDLMNYAALMGERYILEHSSSSHSLSHTDSSLDTGKKE